MNNHSKQININYVLIYHISSPVQHWLDSRLEMKSWPTSHFSSVSPSLKLHCILGKIYLQSYKITSDHLQNGVKYDSSTKIEYLFSAVTLQDQL